MSATWDMIKPALEEYSPVFAELPDCTQYSAVRSFVGEKEPRGETLYLTFGNDGVNTASESGFSGIISVGGDSLLPGVCALLPETVSVAALRNTLQDLFDRISKLELDIATAAGVGDFQRVISLAHDFTGKRVALLDRTLRKIALAPDEDCDEDPEWTHLRRHGYSSAETIRKLYESGALDEMQHFTRPMVRKTRVEMPFTTIVTNMLTASSFEARMLIIGNEFTPDDFYVSRLVSTEYLRVQKTFTRGPESVSRTLYGFFSSLIEGKTQSAATIESMMFQLSNWDGGRFRVLCVDMNIANEIFEYYTRQLFASVKAYCIKYDDILVAVICYSADEYVHEIEPALLTWLETNSVYGSISFEYADLNETGLNYRRALLALTHGASASHMRHFYECAPVMITAAVPESERELYAHPATGILRAWDQREGTPYHETLRAYLLNERSLVETAKSLYIHRNTVQYRLKQISDIIQADLDDPMQRIHLMLSFMLEEYG